MAGNFTQIITRTFGLKTGLAEAAGSNFYYSFIFLPGPKRRAIKNVYSFCRILDDLVDRGHPEADAEAEIRVWRQEIEACYSGCPETDLGERLMEDIEEFSLPIQPFLDILDGMEMDLHWHSYQTFSDLREYCYRVASAVGLICIEIFGYESPRVREYAVNLGLALQMTNILRDMKEDAARGRIYIPLEDLERFGYSEKDLISNLYNAPFIELMKFEHARAKYYFDRAAESLPQADRPSLFAAEIMGEIYRELLEGIAGVGFDVFRNRVAVPRSRRIKIALEIRLRSLFKR